MTGAETMIFAAGGLAGIWLGYLAGIWRGAARAARSSSRSVRGKR